MRCWPLILSKPKFIINISDEGPEVRMEFLWSIMTEEIQRTSKKHFPEMVFWREMYFDDVFFKSFFQVFSNIRFQR